MSRIAELAVGPAVVASGPIRAVVITVAVLAAVMVVAAGVLALVVVRRRRLRTRGPELPPPVVPASVVQRSPARSVSWYPDRALTVLPGQPLSSPAPVAAEDDAPTEDVPTEKVTTEKAVEDPRTERLTAPDPVTPPPSSPVVTAPPVLKTPPVLKAPSVQAPPPVSTTAAPAPADPGEAATKQMKQTKQTTQTTQTKQTKKAPSARTATTTAARKPAPKPAQTSVPKPVPKTPKPRSKPTAATRRGATKRQQTRLAELVAELGEINGRIQLAEVATQEALDLVGADTAALIVQSIAGARVLAASPHPAGGPEIWGVRTLVALLSRPEPVRLVLDGDPLAGGARTSLLTAPVPAGGRSVGVLVCRRRAARTFSVSDEDALARLARICGDRLHRTPERVAVAAKTVDRGTGLGGKDLLRHDLTDALRARPDHDLPVALVVAEVLGLARLRTARGTAAADTALAGVAERVASVLRVGDLIYRLGADELAVLLPATDDEAAEAVSERLAELDLPAVADHGGPVELALRTAAVPLEGEVESVLLAATRSLKARQVAERWSEPAVV